MKQIQNQTKYKKILIPFQARMLCNENGDVYKSNEFNKQFFDRYRNICEKITVVCSAQITDQNEDNYNIFEKDKSIEIINLKTKKRTNFIQRGLLIKKTVKEQLDQSDAVIVKAPCFLDNYLVRKCNRKSIPILLEFVGCPWDALWNYGTIQGKLIAPFMWLKARRAVKKAPFVLYVSKFFLQNRYPTKNEWESAPDVELQNPDSNVLNSRLNRINSKNPRDKIFIGTFGYLNCAYRRFDTSIDCLEKLRNGGYDAYLKIIGGGDQLKWKKYAENKNLVDYVEFSGHLPEKKDVFKWIDSIDIMMLPTAQETLGRFCIEAMSRGCPVIGTVDTALREQLPADCLFHVGDADFAYKLLTRLIDDKEYQISCAKENFYKSFRYSKSKTFIIRQNFYQKFLEYGTRK